MALQGIRTGQGQGDLSSVELTLLQALRMGGARTIDQLASLLPSVSWSQVFLAVDRLSRVGAVTMRRAGNREYLVSLGPAGGMGPGVGQGVGIHGAA
ncbi:MAG: hypothetical protein AB1411_00215 [Nitrospirota bacterium]